MTTPTRRTFLLGLGATVALPITSKFEVAFPDETTICPVSLCQKFSYRAIQEFMFSSIPDDNRSGINCVKYTLSRSNSNSLPLIQLSMHPLAFMRWVAAPKEEIIIENGGLNFDVNPCMSNCTLNMVSNVERNMRKKPIFLSENFHWENGKLIKVGFDMLNPLNKDLLA